ncbi:hypothetical protein GCM10027082_33030 [Comamonas humi]
MTVDAGAVHAVAANGEESLACTDLIVQGGGTVALNGGSIVQIRNVSNSGTIDGSPSGTLDVNGDWTNNGSFVAAGSTVRLSNRCGASTLQLSGATTFNNLDISGQNANSPVTVVLPSPNTVVTAVNGALTFGGNGTPVAINGPTCAGILLGPNAPAPNLANVTLGPGIWIARQPPAQCGGGTPGGQAVPVPGLGMAGAGWLSLLLGGVAAWGRRRARQYAPRR